MTQLSRAPRALHVVHICKVKGIAGTERHLLDLLPALQPLGIDARVVVLEDPAFPVPAFHAALAERQIACDVERIVGHVDPGLPRRLKRRLLALAPDVVHTHLFHADIYGLAAATRARVRAAVSTRHDNNPFRRKPYVRWLNRQAMRHAQRIVAISHAVAGFVRDVEGARERAIVRIPYGIDVAALDRAASLGQGRFGPFAGGPVIGAFGRLIEQKGFDVLLDAMPEVRARHCGARLVIVGDGPLREPLEAQARRLRLSDCVDFAGWIDHAGRFMRDCDVIVMPSRWEGFGLAALEALASGCALVASRVDGLAEIVRDGTTGVLVGPGDPHRLADAVSRLLQQPQRARELGRAARRDVCERFSLDRTARATAALYREIVDEQTCAVSPAR